MMSGSGPTVFGIFENKEKARLAYVKMKNSKCECLWRKHYVRRCSIMAGKLSKVNLNDYKPLREVIFNTLKEAIISGELKPGERLMEVKLAEKMGVSRTPVREAIRKLELDGLVEMLPRKGAHVAELSVKNIMDV